MHLGLIEAVQFFTIDTVEHVFTLSSQVDLEVGLVVDVVELVTAKTHLLGDVAAQDEEVLLLGVGSHGAIAGIEVVQQLGLLFAKIHLPEVVAALE